MRTICGMTVLDYPIWMLDYEKIRTLREKLGLNQEEAAKLAGLGSKSRWSDIETGERANVRLDTLGKIAAALKVEPADLLLKKKRGGK